MNSLLNSDKFTNTFTNRNTGVQQRKWIEYADGMFEPVRRDGNLNKKYHGDRRKLDWWTVEKPLDWNPSDEGKEVTLNHDYRRPGKKSDDRIDVLPARNAKAGTADKGRQTDVRMGKGQTAARAEKGAEQPGQQPSTPPSLKTTLLLGAEAYHEFEAQRQAKRTESKDKDPRPNVYRGEAAGKPPETSKPTDSSKPENPAPSGAGAAAGAASGMVKPNKQRGQGPATGNDERIKTFKEQYEAADSNRKPKLKEGFKKEIDELKDKAKKAKGKERKKLLRRADQWKGALKVITDGKVRPSGPLMLFNIPLMEKLLENPFVNPSTPSKI